jgi:peroxiredoxin
VAASAFSTLEVLLGFIKRETPFCGYRWVVCFYFLTLSIQLVVGDPAGVKPIHSIPISIVDSQGKPVPGADVIITGYECNGNPRCWVGGGVSIADKDGLAIVDYSSEAEAEATSPQPNITLLNVSVQSPEFAATHANVPIPSKTVVTLLKGTKLVVSARGVNNSPIHSLHIKLGEFQGNLDCERYNPLAHWYSSQDKKSFFTQLIPGSYTLCGIALQEDNTVCFSDITDVQLLPGKEVHLNLDMKPGMTVTGKVDDTIPRPITQGIIYSEVTCPHGDNEDSGYRWETMTGISSDGTFRLNSIPPGTLALMGSCKGFMRRTEQSYPSLTVPIVLQMEPTSSAKLSFEDADGKPLPNVKASIFVGSGFGGIDDDSTSGIFGNEAKGALPSFTESFEHYAISDASGIATITDLPIGKWGVEITRPATGNQPAISSGSANQSVEIKHSEPNPTQKRFHIDVDGMVTSSDSLVGSTPNISFIDVNGVKVDLQQMRGKVVLINFWATWCGPCVGEMPRIRDLYNRYHTQGLEVIGISLDRDRDALLHFIQGHDIPWPQYFQKEGDNTIARQFGIDGIPVVFIINKEGMLVDESGREKMELEIPKLLQQNFEVPSPDPQIK